MFRFLRYLRIKFWQRVTYGRYSSLQSLWFKHLHYSRTLGFFVVFKIKKLALLGKPVWHCLWKNDAALTWTIISKCFISRGGSCYFNGFYRQYLIQIAYFDSPLHATGKICTRLATDVPNLKSVSEPTEVEMIDLLLTGNWLSAINCSDNGCFCIGWNWSSLLLWLANGVFIASIASDNWLSLSHFLEDILCS